MIPHTFLPVHPHPWFLWGEEFAEFEFGSPIPVGLFLGTPGQKAWSRPEVHVPWSPLATSSLRHQVLPSTGRALQFAQRPRAELLLSAGPVLGAARG